MKTFYVHVSLAEGRTETIVPITAENLDAANDWAEENYGKFGIEVTRIRPKV
ncbi:MAG: host cell RNA polymerase inhibitor [Fusobacteriaceae bacterium]